MTKVHHYLLLFFIGLSTITTFARARPVDPPDIHRSLSLGQSPMGLDLKVDNPNNHNQPPVTSTTSAPISISDRFSKLEHRLLRVEIELDKLIRYQLQPRSPRSPMSGLVRRSHVGGRNAKSPMSTGHIMPSMYGVAGQATDDYFSVVPNHADQIEDDITDNATPATPYETSTPLRQSRFRLNLPRHEFMP